MSCQNTTDGVLVVGVAMEGHNLRESQTGSCEFEADGRSVPWNTLGLWNLEYLQRFGFPLVGDALFDPKQAGVEELSAVALYQHIYPNLKAFLVTLPGIRWNTGNFDEERRAKHEAKMASKVSRPAAQMTKLGFRYPLITHLS